MAMFRAEPSMPVSSMMKAMAAAAGSNCSNDEMWNHLQGGNSGRCGFYGFIIEADSGEPPRRPADEDVWGNLDTSDTSDPDRIRTIVRSHLDEVRACYDAVLVHDPTLGGRVNTRFTIDEEGKVGDASITASTLANAEVEDCLVETIRTWTFPDLTGAKDISYPFNFTPG